MGKKAEPLTVREKYLTHVCDIGEKRKVGAWNVDAQRYLYSDVVRPVYLIRKMLEYRKNHPANVDLRKLRDDVRKLNGGVLDLLTIEQGMWRVSQRFGKKYLCSYPLILIMRYIDAEERIAGMSDKQIHQLMVLEAI
jgi:hypothetical protein